MDVSLEQKDFKKNYPNFIQFFPIFSDFFRDFVAPNNVKKSFSISFHATLSFQPPSQPKTDRRSPNPA